MTSFVSQSVRFAQSMLSTHFVLATMRTEKGNVRCSTVYSSSIGAVNVNCFQSSLTLVAAVLLVLVCILVCKQFETSA